QLYKFSIFMTVSKYVQAKSAERQEYITPEQKLTFHFGSVQSHSVCVCVCSFLLYLLFPKLSSQCVCVCLCVCIRMCVCLCRRMCAVLSLCLFPESYSEGVSFTHGWVS